VRIFLSHSHRDKALVREVRSYLPGHVSTWIDENELLIGEDLKTSIRDAIQEEADFVIIFFGQEAMKSEWIRRELAWALDREKQIGRVFILPILLDDIWSKIEPTEFRDRVYLTCFDQGQASVKALAEKLSDHLFTWLSRHLESSRARELEEQRKQEVAKQAGEALVSLTKDDTWDEARVRNLARTYKELTLSLGGLPDDVVVLRLKERLQKKIAFSKKQVEESRGSALVDRPRGAVSTPGDFGEVAGRAWDVVTAAVLEQVKRSTEEHYVLLCELSANIAVLEERNAKASDILTHVREFLIHGERGKDVGGYLASA